VTADGSPTTSSPLEVVHHDGHDPAINPMFVPAIRVGSLVFVSGLTAAPTYHAHPHRPEDFDSVPPDAEGQARALFDNLDRVLEAVGVPRAHVVQVNRFFTDVEADQDAVNRVQSEFFAGHLPTSTSVEVKRLATDARLRLEINAVLAV
jgi:enamine deaminase RidA (YjgF/YER057c/UK114 family)